MEEKEEEADLGEKQAQQIEENSSTAADERMKNGNGSKSRLGEGKEISLV